MDAGAICGCLGSGLRCGVSVESMTHRTIPNGRHKFGPGLVCGAEGCSVDWRDQQANPTKCEGKHPARQRAYTMRRVIRPPMPELAALCKKHGLLFKDVAKAAVCGSSQIGYAMRGPFGVSDGRAGDIEMRAWQMLALRGVG